MSNLVTFESLEVGQHFFDPNCGEYLVKVCGNAADFTSGGDYFSGCLATFDDCELVQPCDPRS